MVGECSGKRFSYMHFSVQHVTEDFFGQRVWPGVVFLPEALVEEVSYRYGVSA